MFISRGFINLTKYFVPITLAESVSKKGIKLKITAYEARSKYSYSKMKNTLTSLELMPKSTVQHRSLYDRFLTLRYSATRNRMAAAAAFVSGILFLLSGYKANLEIYDLIRMQILTIGSVRELWGLLLAPIGTYWPFSDIGPARRNHSIDGSCFVCCKPSKYGKIFGVNGNRTRTLYYCLTCYDGDMVRKVVVIRK
jgi:hypothetical protein